MNANELADKLESFWLTKNDDLLAKAVVMLRQQHAEIDSLRKNLDVALMMVDDLEKGLDSSINLNKAQAERYGNNEPVAYIDCQDLERLPHHDCWVNGQEHKNNVPLYTHPAKTLTDEEINKLWAESSEDGIAMQQGFTTQQHYFANLILRKAQEK
jgi:hypothetical protein